MLTDARPKTASIADLVQEGPKDFRVHSDVYTDRSVFDQEMHEIFENGWVYVAHESEPVSYTHLTLPTKRIV